MSWVWKYYEKKSKDVVKCQICSADIHRKNGATSAMANHLVLKHSAKLAFDRESENKSKTLTPNTAEKGSNAATEATSLCNDSGSMALLGKRKHPSTTPSIRDFIIKPSLAELLARCAAKDGFSVSGMKNSDAIKGYVKSKGYDLPRSETTIWKMILDFFESKYNEQKKQIDEKIKKHEKFSIALDEWTDFTELRYLMISLHDCYSTFRLGLIPIPKGSCTADVLFDLVTEKLRENSLNAVRDIVATSNDGAKVMESYARLLSVATQLCLNHAIHLSIVDVLYKKKAATGEQLIYLYVIYLQVKVKLFLLFA
jgi:hypothetical protein